ncbi:MAG: NifB/NifX family molybdenum-iron cluster-binding protein [Candidatus Delongbacteria bacterium]
MNFRIAFATDNGKNFVGSHFGDAQRFDIYELDENNLKFLKTIRNTVENSPDHADEKKAGGISDLLLKENIQVAVSKIFGPNIKRIKSHFVCVIVRSEELSDCFDILKNNIFLLKEEWEKGDNRTYLKFGRI